MNGPQGLPGFGPVQRFEAQEARGFLPRGGIDGLILSNDTTDATNDIAIAAGVARSTVRIVDGTPSTLTRDQIDLELPVSIIKQADVAFAPENYDPEGFTSGGRSGGRSTSSLADGTWHYLLAGGAGLGTDVIMHDSLTQSNILAELQKLGGYTAYRNIASIMRESSALVGFIQDDDYFRRKTSILDVSAANPGISAVSRTLSVPIGIRVLADVIVAGVATSNNAFYSLFSDLSVTDETPAIGNSMIPQIQNASGSTQNSYHAYQIWTSTAGQIRSRISASDANNLIYIRTLGWWHPRGRNA